MSVLSAKARAGAGGEILMSKLKKTYVLILLSAVLTAACSATPEASARAEATVTAKALANPVASSPQSIASGKSAFNRLCTDCHGAAGDGVSDLAAEVSTTGDSKALDLTDDRWDRGSTDGEIFIVIRDGLTDGSMKGLNGRPGVGPNEMWNIVNYVRTLGPRH